MRWGRAYFAFQAAAGAAWWIAVAFSPWVREGTLGMLDPVLVALADIPLFVVASAIAAAGVRAAAWVSTVWTILVTIALAIYATVTTEAGVGVLAMTAAAGASVFALALVTLGRVPSEWMLRGPFIFRPATLGSRRANVGATFAQLAVFWIALLGVVPAVLSFLEARWSLALPFPPAAPIVGAMVLVLASALGIWCAITMAVRGDGTTLPIAMPNRLVVSGPYRFVRNPMAVAGMAQGVAVGLLVSSWIVVVYALLGSVLWNYAIRPWEEADLESRFGESYRRYRDEVRCWIPRIPRPRSGGEVDAAPLKLQGE